MPDDPIFYTAGIFIVLAVVIVLGVLTMSAIDDLNTNISQLKTDIETYIAAKTGAVPAAQVDSAAQAVAALDAEVKAAQ